jgi:hypothetical protein
VLLAHHLGEIAWPVFAREDKVRHGPDSIGLAERESSKPYTPHALHGSPAQQP